MLDRISNLPPPHDRSAERALLGAILINNDAIDACVRLQLEDFFDVFHGRLFDGMRKLRVANKPINLVSLRPMVEDLQGNSEAAWRAYCGDLLSVSAISDIDAVAHQIAEYSARRRLCYIAEGLNASARQLDMEIRSAASMAVDGMDEVLAMASERETSRVGFNDALKTTLESFGRDDGSNRVTTGLASLDKVLGGWRRKQFVIVAGRPSMGKTAIITSAMLRTARRGNGVLMFSLEMPVRDLTARCLADISYSPDNRATYADALAGRLSERDARRWGEAAGKWATLPLVIDDQRGVTMAEIGARVRAERQRMERDGGSLGLVVVDHLGLIRASGRYAGNKVQETGEISDALATLAKENDVAVVALQQLNRGTEARENKRPTLSDLRNSGDLEQDADVVCFTYRQAYYLERMKADPGSMQEQQRLAELEQCKNTMEFLIAKNRNGPTTTVELYCDMPCNAIRDPA